MRTHTPPNLKSRPNTGEGILAGQKVEARVNDHERLHLRVRGEEAPALHKQSCIGRAELPGRSGATSDKD